MAMPERELDQAKRHPDVVKNIIKKDGRKDAVPYTPSNPPPYPVTSVNGQTGDITIPPTSGGRIWYATCSTASGAGAKTATSSTGDFVLATGSMVRILFTTSNTAANPTISIDGSTAKAIRPISSASGMANKIAAGEVIDLVYDGSNFVMTKGNAATTSFYGITKLSSATNSTAEDVAATPKAVKDAADAKVDKAGDTMTGDLTFDQNKAIVQTMANSSNWRNAIVWINETPSGFTYKPHIGFWNVGGNSSYPGVIDLVPYGTNTSPWGGADGLSISHDDIRFNGATVRTGNVAVADGGTGATNGADALANLGVTEAFSSGNGSLKLPNGTLIQWGATTPAVASALTQIGTSGIYYGTTSLTFPIAFANANYYLSGVVRYSTGHIVPIGFYPTSSTTAYIGIYDFYARPASSTAYNLRWFAIGRWA